MIRNLKPRRWSNYCPGCWSKYQKHHEQHTCEDNRVRKQVRRIEQAARRLDLSPCSGAHRCLQLGDVRIRKLPTSCVYEFTYASDPASAPQRTGKMIAKSAWWGPAWAVKIGTQFHMGMAARIAALRGDVDVREAFLMAAALARPRW